MTLPSAVSASGDPGTLRRAICARAREFEIGALLDLLATLGYRPADIFFRGQLGEAPQPTLVHRIQFAELAEPDAPEAIADEARAASIALGSFAAPPRRHPAPGPAPVTVTVNLGLLSCRSPLPSYFQHLLRDSMLTEPLTELLQLVDRNLLHSRLICDRPERIVAEWRDITSDLIRVRGLDSLIGLSWLFRHVFPELPVAVERTTDELRVPYASARLGFSALGSACVGATTPVDIHDFQITLHCAESLLRPGVPWQREIDHRLRTIVFPALEPVAMNLTVVLALGDDEAVATLRDADRESYLGVDLLGPSDAATAAPRRIVMYRGLLPDHPPDTDELERMIGAQVAVTVTTGDGGFRDAKTRVVAPTATPPPASPTRACTLRLSFKLAGVVHRYQATVHWGGRAWFRDEPYAIELGYDEQPQTAPSPRHHPQLWNLLRDHARRALSAATTIATLSRYGMSSVTDAMVADLIARGDHAALHALLVDRASNVPREAWERFVRSQEMPC
ncbi:MAG TPA: hypothetical protein VFP84_37230 [Kofleriaceae bacterium]|nr:hypothetical protein [Kofleriaceae bacterium]